MSEYKSTNIPKPDTTSVLSKFLNSGWAFITPWLIGFIILTVIPFACSFYFSFCKYDIISSPVFTGLDNYHKIAQDALFWKCLINTFYYTALAVPLSILLGVILAMLLNLNIMGVSIFRTVFFLPSIIPAVAGSILWIWLLNPQIGLINSLLFKFGICGPTWLQSTTWSKPALVLMSMWGVGGGMVIYLSGLKDIPVYLYEAAMVDGAGALLRTWHITLPMLTPVIFFNLIMGIIAAFQYFTQAYIMTRGGPEDSTMFYCLYLFKRAWSYLDMGYASAMAWLLFVMIIAITMVIFKTHHKWVYYDK